MFAASKSGKAAAGGGGATDPSFGYVPLLLETTSTNGQQNNTFLDSSANNFTITRNGTPTQGSITPYWPDGQWSNLFNGSSDWLGASPNTVSVLNFGTNPYTIEFWFYGLVKAANQMILRAQNATGSLQIYIDTSGIINFGPQNSAVTITIPSANWNINTWNHIAFSRVGTGSNQLTVYVNGVSIASATDSFNYTITGIDIGAGTNFAGGYYLNGYVSNLRTVNGRAVYTGAFTPPTSPLTSTTGGTNPPTGTQCTLLTCQSNRFIDANTAVAAKTFTVNGTPTVQAFQPFSPTASYTTALYGGSGYFNGSTDYLSAASNAAFAFGTGDFTIELWVYVANITNQMIFVDMRGGTSTVAAPVIYMESNGTIIYYVNAVARITSSAITANSWTHIAVSRSSSSTKMFINGVQAGSTYSDSTSYIQSSVFVGRASDNAVLYLNGYLSNLRLVKGTAVYTANFTPPTSPVTAVTNTSLLLNMANAGIYDAAAQNDMITVGDAQASTTQSKWSPTSMKFDGTGDWLTAIDGPQLQLGTGDFTIEGWVYLSAISVAYGIISKGTATTGWSVNVTVLNKLQFSYTASVLTGSTSLATGTWYYFAVVRSGSATGNLKLYLNGSLEATSGGAVTDNFNQTNILYVGADRIGGSALNGYLQDIRITKGVARTVTTTPTAAFPTR